MHIVLLTFRGQCRGSDHGMPRQPTAMSTTSHDIRVSPQHDSCHQADRLPGKPLRQVPQQPSRHVTVSPTVNGKPHGTPRQYSRRATAIPTEVPTKDPAAIPAVGITARLAARPATKARAVRPAASPVARPHGNRVPVRLLAAPAEG